jgi:hypothetical protein
MSSSTPPEQIQPRIVLKKRPLKRAPTTSSHLNPSATPAETPLKQSYQEYLQAKQSNPNPTSTSATEEEEDSNQTPRIEVSFLAPQPFLDPPTWDAMLRLHREKLAVQAAEDSNLGAAQGSRSGSGPEEESAERQRQRAEQEMEYGSMAIRGRSSVRGRGKRGRGRSSIYWGGRS